MARLYTEFFSFNCEHCQRLVNTIITRSGDDQNGPYARIFLGGWNTATTKKRIRDVINPLGWNIGSVKGHLVVWYFKMVAPKDVPFVEGIKLYANGTWELPAPVVPEPELVCPPELLWK